MQLQTKFSGFLQLLAQTRGRPRGTPEVATAIRLHDTHSIETIQNVHPHQFEMQFVDMYNCISWWHYEPPPSW